MLVFPPPGCVQGDKVFKNLLSIGGNLRLRLASVFLSAAILLSGLVVVSSANASSCSWTYTKPVVTGFCFGDSVSLTYRKKVLTGFVGSSSVSLVRNGKLWTGFVDSDSVVLTKVGRGVFSGYVGAQSVLCHGRLPVGCLI